MSEDALAREISDLKRYERNFEAVVEGSLDAILIVDMGGSLLYANPATEGLFEMPRHSMIGADFGFPIVLTEPVQMYILRRFKKHVAVEMWVVSIHWKDNPAYLISLRDITRLVKAKEELNQNKKHLEQEVQARTQDLAHLIEVLRVEVNGHNRVEVALRRSQENLQLALECACMGIWDWSVETGELVWSKRCKEIFGLCPDTVMNYDMFIKAVYPDDRERVDRAVKNALEHKGDYDVEMRILWPDGTVHWASSRGRGLYDASGKAIRMIGVALDVTARKQAEEKQKKREADIHHSRARLQAILDTLPAHRAYARRSFPRLG